MKIKSWLDSMHEERDTTARRAFWRPRIISGTLAAIRHEDGDLQLTTETFRFRNGCYFDTALLEKGSISNALPDRRFCVAPLGFATENGDESEGTVSDEGFRIVHTAKEVRPEDIVSPVVSDHERDFLARLFLTPVLSFRESDWGYAPLVHARRLRANDEGGCVAVVFVAPEGVGLNEYDALAGEVSALTNDSDVHFSEEGRFDSSMIMSLTIDTGAREEDRFIHTESLHLGKIADRLRAKE